jgi:uncharacterized protein YlaI
MGRILGGIAAGKKINCKCTICDKNYSFIGENQLKHDRLYTEMKKKGVAKEYCNECKELIDCE